MKEITKEAVTTEIVCEVIGCSVSVFYSRHKKNLTPIGKSGRTVYYDLQDVEKYNDQLKVVVNNYKIVETWVKK